MEQLQQVNAQREETQQLRQQELEESQQEGEANVEESQRICQLLQRERAVQEENLARHAEAQTPPRGMETTQPLSLKLLNAQSQKEESLTLERLNADELRTELQVAQADLTQ